MNKRIIFGLLAIINFLFFFFWFPLNVYQQSPMLISFIGILILGICLYFTLNDSINIFEKVNENEIESDQNDIKYYIFIGVLFGSFVGFIFNVDNRIKKLMDYEGVETNAIVLEGKHSTNGFIRKVETFDLTIKFSDENGKEHTVYTAVDADNYFSTGKNDAIHIQYSRSNPDIVMVVNSKK